MDNAIDITDKNEIKLSGKVGTDNAISVVGNLTTGYNWFLDTNTYNENEVLCTNLSEHNSGEYVSGNNSMNGMQMCGAPGKCLFKFKLIKVGNQKIRIIYKRAWEDSVNKEKFIEFNTSD